MITFSNARKYGRIAGMFYLIIIICGLFSELYVRSEIIVWHDAAITAQNILNAEFLYRIGILSDGIMVLADVAVGVLFYFLLRNTSHVLALLAAFFRLGQASIIGLNLNNLVKPLILLNGGEALSGIGADRINAEVLFHLNAHAYGYTLSAIFFAASCIVLGVLFIRSDYFPTTLGLLTLIASAGYVVDVVVNIALPDYADISEMIVMGSAIVGELLLGTWLLLKGARQPRMKNGEPRGGEPSQLSMVS